MTDQQITVDEDEDEENEDEDDYGDWNMLGGEEEWEDSVKAKELYNAMPKGWVMVKVINFTHRTFAEMDEWLQENCQANFKRVGFTSHCAYMTAVQFEKPVDAIFFKLRWS